MKWDVFISHASEDKNNIAEPLAELLTRKGVKVWLDQNQLRLGDSLREKIDQGLAESRYGIVVLSKAFFLKDWPKRELNALMSLETSHRKVILPIWHEIDYEFISRYSPTLADKLAIKTSRGLDQVVKEILRVIKEPVHSNQAEPSQLDWGTINDIVGRYLRTRKDSGSDYLNFQHDANILRTTLKRIGPPKESDDQLWQERYYIYLGESSFVCQEYRDAASAYEQLYNLLNNHSYLLGKIVCLACGLATQEATEQAAKIFQDTILELTDDSAINLGGILDGAVSIVFGENFGITNPLLLIYGNNEGRLRDNLERTVEAFFEGLRTCMGTDDSESIGNLCQAFGQVLMNLGVAIIARKYLLRAQAESQVDVSTDLENAERLIRFGFEMARIAGLPGESLPLDDSSSRVELHHRRAFSRLCAVFGKYIDGSSMFDDIDE